MSQVEAIKTDVTEKVSAAKESADKEITAAVASAKETVTGGVIFMPSGRFHIPVLPRLFGLLNP